MQLTSNEISYFKRFSARWLLSFFTSNWWSPLFVFTNFTSYFDSYRARSTANFTSLTKTKNKDIKHGRRRRTSSLLDSIVGDNFDRIHWLFVPIRDVRNLLWIYSYSSFLSYEIERLVLCCREIVENDARPVRLFSVLDSHGLISWNRMTKISTKKKVIYLSTRSFLGPE